MSGRRRKYQIVAGERRYRASKIAGMNNIPVLKMILTAKQIKELSLIENLQRQDLNPIEEAQAYKSAYRRIRFYSGAACRQTW